MRSPFLRALFLLCLAGVAIFALRTHEARAAWPPAPGADMKDKANWPNDYNARWNYLSYFPARNTAAPLYQGVYPLATALGRPLIAKRAVEVAREVGADAIVHGCTGKGNDQVRIELSAAKMCS